MEGDNNGFELMEPASPEALVPDHGFWPWFVAAAVLVILALSAWLLFRKRRPAGKADLHAIRMAAFAEASAALGNPAGETAREAAVLASLILRKYLASAANDPALFETHEEFISRHDSLQALGPEARHAAEEGFIRLAALKYAREIPEAAPAIIVAEARALLETLHHGFAA